VQEEPGADARIDPVELFSPEIRENVRGLAFIGYLTESFRFCGHRFTIETLRPHVKYAIGQAMEPYRNTLVEPDVFASFHVAAALTSVDGSRDFCPPMGDNLREWVDGRFDWVTTETGWLQPTIDFIFIKYAALEERAKTAMVELHSLSEGDQATSQPSPDSSTERAPSTEEINLATPPLDLSSLN
jgi:hypothetical protein